MDSCIRKVSTKQGNGLLWPHLPHYKIGTDHQEAQQSCQIDELNGSLKPLSHFTDSRAESKCRREQSSSMPRVMQCCRAYCLLQLGPACLWMPAPVDLSGCDFEGSLQHKRNACVYNSGQEQLLSDGHKPGFALCTGLSLSRAQPPWG